MNGMEVISTIEKNIGKSSKSVQIVSYSKDVASASNFRVRFEKPLKMSDFIELLICMDEVTTGWRIEIRDEDNHGIELGIRKVSI